MSRHRATELHWLIAIAASVMVGFVSPDLCRAQEVILQLRNGDRLTGAIVAEDSKKITLDAVLLGKIEIPIEQIKRRKQIAPKRSAKAREQVSKSSAPAAVAQKPEAVADKQTAPPAEKKPSEAPKVTPTVALTAKPKPIEPKRKLWKVDLQLGANLQFNQKDTELYTGDFKADYGDPKTRFRHTFDYHVRYGKVDNVPSANNMNGLIRTEFDIAKKLFIFNAVGAGYDDIRKIDFSYEDSFGIGYTLLKMTNFVLSVDGGVNYQKQFFSNGQEPEVFSPRLGEKSSWKISSKFEVSQTFEFYPRSGDFEDYRLRAEGILRYLLNDHISLNLRIAEIYDTRPAPGVTPNDLQINSTIGFRF